ncbi:hypothetical protein L3X38_043835 [Prunus dulcis]|uniref:Retrovirus-related Pol polyprotein from transposon TNT 1-94-like beta-barrel domain-containing protein n=1 Tax=Prunus dulcis TaxID=3755 RepID=A0AAD4UYU3_PRUDU|nr:hypothetical protein L3X38_043835 [Prunus dulcis]
MTDEKSYFSEISTKCVSGMVAFGDGRKSKILGKGRIMAIGTPNLDNVLLVENLQANLISVSQVCDEMGEVEPSSEDTDLETHEPVDGTGTDFEDCNQHFNPVICRPGAKQVEKDHSPSDVIGNVNDKMRTRQQVFRSTSSVTFDLSSAPIAVFQRCKRLLLCVLLRRVTMVATRSRHSSSSTATTHPPSRELLLSLAGHIQPLDPPCPPRAISI